MLDQSTRHRSSSQHFINLDQPSGVRDTQDDQASDQLSTTLSRHDLVEGLRFIDPSASNRSDSSMPARRRLSSPTDLSIPQKRFPFAEPTTPRVVINSAELSPCPEEPDHEQPPYFPCSPSSTPPKASRGMFNRFPLSLFDRSSAETQQYLPLKTTSSLNADKRRRRIHPIALLPAFVLGFFIASCSLRGSSLRALSSSSLVITNPFSTSGWPLSSGSQKPPSALIHHRDHVYFPYNYLNQTWTTAPGTHQYPLLQLIQNASIAWNAKVSRQSKSLAEAVAEYRRRYRRSPPTGFKEWYNWSTANGVVLIDEYDRINELIEPFWALPPHVLRKKGEHAGQGDAFSTFVIKNGKVSVTGAKKNAGRTKDQLKLLEVIAPNLPDVNATISHHDGPSVFMDWKTRQKHVEYARAGKVLPPDEFDKVEDDASLPGFIGACAPDSPMRMLTDGLGHDLKVKNAGPGGYIGLDHAKTMDMCAHPEWKELHGFTSWAGPPPKPLEPIFSFAQSTAFVADILAAPLEQFDDSTKNADQMRPWAQKKDGQHLLWRGQTTGIWFDRQTKWRKSHRVRLHRLGQAARHPYGTTLKRMLRTPLLVLNGSREDEVVVTETEHTLAELSQRYLSTSFVGKLVQCSVEDGSCEKISKEIDFSKPVDWLFQNNFKYVLDVDGNSWSGRFRRLLASNALVFKSTIWPEWYRDHIQPWYHYVPVRIDYQDVFDLMSFFTGGIKEQPAKEVRGFEEVGERIANQGTEWVGKHFRYEDIQAYTWRTYLEWARVSSDNRLEMNLII